MDALSAGASVITVVSIAVQLVESVKHLYEFWESIGDAPESVRDIAKELRILSNIIASTANPALLQESNPDMKLVLETCATQIDILKSISQKLDEEFASTSMVRRKWTAVKVVFKAEKINHFRDTIERTKSTLILANQQHTLMMVVAGFEEQRQWQGTMRPWVIDNLSQRHTIRAASSEVNIPVLSRRLGYSNETQRRGIGDPFRDTEDNATATTNSCRVRTMVAASCTGVSSIFGKLSLRLQKFSTSTAQPCACCSSDEDGEKSTQSLLTIRPALWLARFGIKYGLQVGCFQSLGHWKYVLNTFRPVSDDSIIFDFCKLGNIDGVRLLLSKGKASTWDTNSLGERPLHIAAEHAYPQLCKFLLDAGADPETRRDDNFSCFNIACSSDMERDTVKKIDTLRLFIHQADLSQHRNLDWRCIELLANREPVEEGRYLSGLSGFIWVVNGLKDDIRGNINDSEMADIFWEASLKWGLEDMRKLVADFNRPVGIAGWTGWTPLHYCVWFRDYTSAGLLAHHGADLHSAALNHFFSPFEESPTSISLYSSTAFSAWRKVLEGEQLSLENFVMLELQHGRLKSEGWDKYSLMKVFTLDFQPTAYPVYCCNRCSMPHQQFSLVETAWLRTLQQINLGQDLHNCPRHESASDRCDPKQHEECTPKDSLRDDWSEFSDENLGSYSSCCEWVCVHCWHGMHGIGHDYYGCDTEDEDVIYHNSNNSDDKNDDDDGDDDADYNDDDNSSDGSPFLFLV